jgi:hypothetical protein
VRWDGTSWRVFDTGLRHIGVGGIDAVSATNLWATGATFTSQGQGDRVIVAHWDGRVTRVLYRSGHFSDLGLSDPVAAGHDVWVVGVRRIQQWDGRRWRRVNIRGVYLSGADDVSSHDIWAVGDHPGPGGNGSRGVAIYHYACR